MSWIANGKSLAKISDSPASISKSLAVQASIKSDSLAEAVSGALKEVTALFYNESRGEIYSGNRDGRVHVWSN